MKIFIKSQLKLFSGFFVAVLVLGMSPQVASNKPHFEPNTGVAGLSFNWAGYVTSGNSKYTEVSGTWMVPEISSPVSNTADGTWVGIGGVSRNDLIQAGTQAITDGTGKINYQAWYEMIPDNSIPVSLAINPGDSLTTTITQHQPDQWVISINNNTTGQSFTTDRTYSSSLSSAEWIEEMPSSDQGFIPLDNFQSLDFIRGATVKDGQAVTIGDSRAQPLSMVDSIGNTLVQPSILGADNASFTVAQPAYGNTADLTDTFSNWFSQTLGFGSSSSRRHRSFGEY